jgi:threonyl-tRNA synthetase
MIKGFAVEIDTSGDKLDKKIRNAQIEAFNYIGVIGQKEVEEKKITLRKRD